MRRMESVIAHDGDMALRRMRNDADDRARVLTWRAEPHVRAFWDNDDEPAIDDAFFDENYAPTTDPSHATTGAIIEVAGAPVGYLQFYPWSAYPEGARATSIDPDDGVFGLDVFVGDPRYVGRGVGTRAVDLACRYLFASRGAVRVALLTAIDNLGAQRAYEKAGFCRVREALDTDTRGGARIASWLMVRDR